MSATIATSFATLVVTCRTVTAIGQAAILNTSGNVTVNPGCTITRDNTQPLVSSNCISSLAGSVTINNCIVASALDSGTAVANVTTSISTYTGCRIVCTGNNASGATNLSGTMILKGVTIIATGTGESIVANSTVKCYGANEANLAAGAGVVQQINTIVIDTNVN